MLTDTAGAVAATFDYGSFGALTSSTGTATTPPLFVGQYLDSESSMYYLRARYYDPATSLFLTLDPLLSSTGVPYTYAGNDPVNATDPTGLWNWGLIGLARTYYGVFNVIEGSALIIAGTAAEATIFGIGIGISMQAFGALRVASGVLNLYGGAKEVKDYLDTTMAEADQKAADERRLIDEFKIPTPFDDQYGICTPNRPRG